MDLSEGSDDWLDDLRTYGRFQDAIDDDQLQAGWDRMCDLALAEVKADFTTDAPPRVREWALSVAAMYVRAAGQGGIPAATPDGVVPSVVGGGAQQVRQRRGILGRDYGQPHVTISAGTT